MKKLVKSNKSGSGTVDTNGIAVAQKAFKHLDSEVRDAIAEFWSENISIGHRKLGRIVMGLDPIKHKE